MLLLTVAALQERRADFMTDFRKRICKTQVLLRKNNFCNLVAGLGPQRSTLLGSLRASVPTSFGGLKVALAQDFAVNEQMRMGSFQKSDFNI